MERNSNIALAFATALLVLGVAAFVHDYARQTDARVMVFLGR